MGSGRKPVLYLAPWVDLGGSDKGTIDWFKHIDRTRWAPSLITTQPASNRWLHQLEPYAEEVWELPDLMPGEAFPAFILGFIESRGVELVHIMNSRLAFDLLPDMSCLRRPPAVVVQMHAEEPDRSGYVRYVSTRYGNLVDAFSVTSEQLKAAVTDYDIAPSKIEVIYSGVDADDEFNPERTEPFERATNGAPRILWPGRLAEQKDPMLTLDVLAQVRDRGTDFVLDIVGDGHMEPDVRARAEQLGLADMIEWSPPSQEMARWYRSSDLLLMTSVFEGVPYVIYESLAMGVPVVAPALPGNVEFMDGQSGALVDPRDDAGQYADAIVRLLEDDELRRGMGARSRERMREEFSLAEMGRRHDELYDRLLRARPASDDRRDAGIAVAEGDAPAPEPAPPEPLRLTRDEPRERTVGVIVPCYRHGIFLADCIESIKGQTLKPSAIVVVDDGSDDPETIAALAALDDDPAVTVLRQETNRGPSAARNRALDTIDCNYVLPLDADDQLLPDALERMVAQLEAAPADVGFVYPNPQHIGNRSDYVPSPAYNLWLLMANNYCPAPALFDRRVFEAGVRYAEEIVFGHEDWDLVLELAGRGVHGRHADGPTFLYRRRGFSRVNAVEYGPHSFHAAIERRHPSLYSRRDEIKASWAPAVSLLLLDDEGGRWTAADVEGLERQTCRDFEVISATDLGAGTRVVERSGCAGEWLATALREARGRWIAVLGTPTAAAAGAPSFVEHVVRAFWADGETAAVVLADAPAVRRHGFAQLTDEERLDATPLAVAFARSDDVPLSDIELDAGRSLIEELAFHVQAMGTAQWRLAPVAARRGDAADGSVATVRERTTIDLRPERDDDPGEAQVRAAIAFEPPRLPELEQASVRRWAGAPTWIPPETHPLCRHRSLAGDDWRVTTSREPPEGYLLEFDLGVLHNFALPGTRRLVDVEDSFELTDDENDLSDGRRGLGYVEQAPFPMLVPLELRRLRSHGRHVLAAGTEDPLLDTSDHVANLGWIEPFPILPRKVQIHRGAWGVETLRRYADLDAWRHRYRVGVRGDEPDSVALGSLLPRGGDGFVELRLGRDGRLHTELLDRGARARSPLRAARWVVAPLTWSGGVPPGWARRATASRLRHLLPAGRHGDDPVSRRTLGWLRRDPAPGFSPLYSATHPVTGDQFVTRSEIEAGDLGYVVDGVLGHVFDAGADRTRDVQPSSIVWGSRFGKGRRYREGPASTR